jgi:hypothetical protein
MTQIKSHGSIGRRSIAHIAVRLFGLVLLLGAFAGCAGGLGQTFMVQFMPFLSTPVGQGQATVQAAIAYANANPLTAVTIDGFHYGQYSNQYDSLAEERVRTVVSMLVAGGVDRARIDILGEGIAYAQGSPMPSLPPETVKIAIGL